MKERPILFNGEMVKAILNGTKTQTRRVLKPQPESFGSEGGALRPLITECPYGYIGDRLWVKETHAIAPCNCCVSYRADDDPLDAGEKWSPSIFMPRRFSRITLKITGVRVERLQNTSEEDARAEGVEPVYMDAESMDNLIPPYDSYREGFAVLWDKINGKKSPWHSNPWLWVITFKII